MSFVTDLINLFHKLFDTLNTIGLHALHIPGGVSIVLTFSRYVKWLFLNLYFSLKFPVRKVLDCLRKVLVDF